MKLKYLFLILFYSFLFKSYSQHTFQLKKEYSQEYKKFESNGDLVGGLRNGRWVDSSKTGIVYLESFYNSGKPIGTWKLNYPNGKIRKEMQYDSISNIKRWKRYQDEKVIIDIIPDSFIDVQTIKKILSFEEKLFDIELISYIPYLNGKKKSIQEYSAAVIINEDAKNSINSIDILNELKGTSFNGSCTVYHENSLLKGNAVFINGKTIYSKRYFYKKSVLKDLYFYKGDTLQSITKYDSKGNIKKVKLIKSK